jgi:hypothetical protein
MRDEYTLVAPLTKHYSIGDGDRSLPPLAGKPKVPFPNLHPVSDWGSRSFGNLVHALWTTASSDPGLEQALIVLDWWCAVHGIVRFGQRWAGEQFLQTLRASRDGAGFRALPCVEQRAAHAQRMALALALETAILRSHRPRRSSYALADDQGISRRTDLGRICRAAVIPYHRMRRGWRLPIDCEIYDDLAHQAIKRLGYSDSLDILKSPSLHDSRVRQEWGGEAATCWKVKAFDDIDLTSWPTTGVILLQDSLEPGVFLPRSIPSRESDYYF